MITLELHGFQEAISHIDSWIRLLESTEMWIEASTESAEVLHRFAVSISPVVTGSYRDAHTVFPRGRGAVLTIDPSAMNRGVPVTDYAGAVEQRHNVYGRTSQQMTRAGAAGVEVLRRRFV